MNKVDIVLQAAGQHSWNLARGWANAARQLGMFNRLFSPQSEWGDAEARDDDGLFDYLANPKADAILLLGFDWHSQILHMGSRWKRRWQESRITKILYIHESIEDNCRLWEHDQMKEAAISAADCVDLIVYNDLADKSFLESIHPHIRWQPYGVDETVFTCTKRYTERIAEAVFRGKVTPFYTNKSYQRRREYIEYLQANEAITLLPYDTGQEAYKIILQDYNNYRIALNFPSLGHNHPSRVPEVLCCGATLLTNRTGIRQNDDLFEHRKHLWYYSHKEELLEGIKHLKRHPDVAERIARDGRQYVLENLTLAHQLRELLGWSQEKPHSAPHLPSRVHRLKAQQNTILVDGVMFQIQRGCPLGISRVWNCLLTELAKSEHRERILVLDRDNTAPRIPGIRYRSIRSYNIHDFEDEACYLQGICNQEEASLFFSTYYTWPETTPSVLMIHDMIAEARGMDLNEPQWLTKTKAIQNAFAYLAVSEATIKDFRSLYPEYSDKKVFLTLNSVADAYRPRTSTEIERFKSKFGIKKPYFVLSGMRVLYKNAMLFFRAFQLLPNRRDFEIICTGAKDLEPCFLPLVREVTCRVLFLSDEELSTAFSGATALVYPSQYEGFGLPIVEAQKAACPVITCRNSSIPEVAGDAALYVGEIDVKGMRDALERVCDPAVRNTLIAAGLRNGGRFSWEATGKILSSAISELLVDTLTLPKAVINPINTTGRLAYKLFSAGSSQEKALAKQLLELNDYYRSKKAFDERSVENCEEALAPLLAERIHEIMPQLAPMAECDSLLSYVLGILFETQKEPKSALQRYTHALKGSSSLYNPHYKRQIGLRLARLSLDIGGYAHAKDVLLKLVLKTRPNDPAALELLQQIERTQKDAITRPRAKLESNLSKTPLKPAPQSAVRVSAIVSAYNAERFMRGCLNDLVRQTLYLKGGLEIVVVDSGSQQNERAIVEDFQKRFQNIIYIRSDARETVYAAWNRAIKEARGQYITNANTDDRHREDALEVLANALDENPSVTLAYADCLITRTENATFENPHRVDEYRWLEFDRIDLLNKGCFVGPQPMWRREVHTEHGFFDPDFVSAGDYEFWLRIARNRTFLHLKETLGLYLDAPNSIEHINQPRAQAEIAKARGWHGASILAFSQSPAPVAAPACSSIGALDRTDELLGAAKFADAWASTLTAIKLRPFHPEAYLALARIALAAGDASSARRCAQFAKQLVPDFKPAKKFLKKDFHGSNRPEWLVLPEQLASKTSQPSTRLSVCLIVKNEERFIGQCLASLKGLADQIVVVDTGSTDRTVAIAKEYGAEIHSFTWCNDFSAARNAALEHATGDWVLSLDADEELPPENHAALRKLLEQNSVICWRLPLFDVGRENEGHNLVPRLFRNAPGLHWTGRVHEQVFTSVELRRIEWGLENRIGDAALRHHGYTKELIQERGKVERNLRLLEQAVKETPNDPLLEMNYGLELCRSDRLDEGLRHYAIAFDLMSRQPTATVTPETREALLTQYVTHLRIAKCPEKVPSILTSPLARSGELTASQHFLWGLAYMELQDFPAAAQQMRHCLAKRDLPAFTPINSDIRTAIPRHSIALCLWQMKDSEGAAQAFQAALADAPHAVKVHVDYANFLHEQTQTAEALQLLHGFTAENPTAVEAWVAGGKIALSQPHLLEVAVDWTDVACKHHPKNQSILAQRAEVLMLAGQSQDALTCWIEADGKDNPRQLAARMVCETALSLDPYRPSASMAEAIDQEYIQWYWRLVEFGAEATVLQLHANVGALDSILPEAAELLNSIIAKLEVAEKA